MLCAKPVDYLAECWQKQVPRHSALHLIYSEAEEKLYHAAEPWQTLKHAIAGSIWCTANSYAKLDTLKAASGKLYFSRTQYSPEYLLFCNYGDTSLATITRSEWEEEVYDCARYSPCILLDYFHEHQKEYTHKSEGPTELYSLTIHKTIVTLAVRRSDSLLESARMLSADDLLGDIEDTLSYNDYQTASSIAVPCSIMISRKNGHVKGSVQISSITVSPEVPKLFDPSTEFKFAEEQPEKKPEVTVQKYSDRVHFINLAHTDSRSMVVEFPNYLVVVESPLASKNGEMILDEIQKFAPNKPVQYFVFGHHHPWYLGGMRPFVHHGATVISTAADIPYIQYLASAPHTLEPDSLQLEHRALKTQVIQDSLTIGDAEYQMKLFVIGKRSQHTNDYVVCYLPKEKLVFEGDLAWIPTEGAIKKASTRQVGLYNAVKELGLQVDTVVQAWPLKEYDVKTIFSFSDLETSVFAK